MLPTVEAQVYTQIAVIERNGGATNGLGAETALAWQPLAKVPCRAWWWKGSRSSDKSPSGQYARPQLTMNVTGGDMAMPLGTDVTDEDRIAEVTDRTGATVEKGPFRVIAVNTYNDHLELSLERP